MSGKLLLHLMVKSAKDRVLAKDLNEWRKLLGESSHSKVRPLLLCFMFALEHEVVCVCMYVCVNVERGELVCRLTPRLQGGVLVGGTKWPRALFQGTARGSARRPARLPRRLEVTTCVCSHPPF